MENKFEYQVVDFIVSTTDFTESNEIEVNASPNYIEVTIDGDTITFFNTGEVTVTMDGEYKIKYLDTIKEVMESGEEIWMMFNNCFEEVNECTINR